MKTAKHLHVRITDETGPESADVYLTTEGWPAKTLDFKATVDDLEQAVLELKEADGKAAIKSTARALARLAFFHAR